MFKAEFLYCDTPGASHAHCACIVQAPDGRLIAAWYVYPEEETKGAQLVMSQKGTTDAAWPYAKPIDLGVASSLGNPVLFFGRDEVSANHEDTEFPKMIKMLSHAAKLLEDRPIKIYNCSPVSTLECFPHMSFEEAIRL